MGKRHQEFYGLKLMDPNTRGIGAKIRYYQSILALNCHTLIAGSYFRATRPFTTFCRPLNMTWEIRLLKVHMVGFEVRMDKNELSA
jgi:hypothetical protein